MLIKLAYDLYYIEVVLEHKKGEHRKADPTESLPNLNFSSIKSLKENEKKTLSYHVADILLPTLCKSRIFDGMRKGTFRLMLRSSLTMKRGIQSASYRPFINNENTSLTMSVSTYFEFSASLLVNSAA